MSVIQPTLPGFDPHRRRAYASVADIQRETADYFQVSLHDLLSDRRGANIARPRQVAMYLASKRTPYSWPRIGREFHRDHSTVMHACAQVKKRMAADPQLAAQIQALEARL